jgi:hypothetical protein
MSVARSRFVSIGVSLSTQSKSTPLLFDVAGTTVTSISTVWITSGRAGEAVLCVGPVRVVLTRPFRSGATRLAVVPPPLAATQILNISGIVT